MNVDFEQKIALLQQQHEALLQRSNLPVEETNGIVCRYTYPIVTREHIPLEWRYDLIRLPIHIVWSVSVLTQP